MASGLIWAGLGRGIAEAGKTYGDTMIRATEADMAEDRAAKRAEMLEQIKEERQAAKQLKLSNELTAAEEAGHQAVAKRELGGEKVSPLDFYDAQIDHARKGGSVDAVELLRKARADALAEIREENRVKRDEARDDLSERRFLQTGDIAATNAKLAEQRNDLMLKRIEKMGTGGGGGSGGRGDGLGNEKLEISRAREKRLDIQKRIDVVMNQVKERMIKKDEGMAKIKELETQQATYDKIIEGADESPKKGTTATKNEGKSRLTTLPKGAVQIGTSGGKPVYQTPDGKKFRAE